MKNKGCKECVCEIWECFEEFVGNVYWNVKIDSWLKLKEDNWNKRMWIRKEGRENGDFEKEGIQRKFL